MLIEGGGTGPGGKEGTGASDDGVDDGGDSGVLKLARSFGFGGNATEGGAEASAAPGVALGGVDDPEVETPFVPPAVVAFVGKPALYGSPWNSEGGGGSSSSSESVTRFPSPRFLILRRIFAIVLLE